LFRQVEKRKGKERKEKERKGKEREREREGKETNEAVGVSSKMVCSVSYLDSTFEGGND